MSGPSIIQNMDGLKNSQSDIQANMGNGVIIYSKEMEVYNHIDPVKEIIDYNRIIRIYGTGPPGEPAKLGMVSNLFAYKAIGPLRDDELNGYTFSSPWSVGLYKTGNMNLMLSGLVYIQDGILKVAIASFDPNQSIFLYWENLGNI